MSVLYAAIGEELIRLPDSNNFSIGGSKATGFKLSQLKNKNEYAVISRTVDGINIHPLLGKGSAKIIKLNQKLSIEDLEIINLQPVLLDIPKEQKFFDYNLKLISFMEAISLSQDLKPCLTDLLSYLCNNLHFEQGSLIKKNHFGQFKIITSIGMDDNEDLLSESIVQKTIHTKQAIFVGNIVSSDFSSAQSILASNFVSMFSIPIILRSHVLGVLLFGTRKPHSGVDRNVKEIIDLIVNSIAVGFHFLNDKDEMCEKFNQLDSIDTFSNPFQSIDENFAQVIQLAKQVSPTDLAILIKGETGTGKEVMANYIHKSSDRAKKEMVSLNCAAIPENLLESILFGHKKGAFTGADKDHAGKVIQAHGSTLFLDEIGDLSLSLQAKLLRVIQEKSVEPVGSLNSTAVDFRLLCATHKDLLKMVEEGSFREDLYFRLAELCIELPPLRDRPADIIIIAKEYLEKNCPDLMVEESTWEWLRSQKWSGNVRELLSSLKRATAICFTKKLSPKEFQLASPLRYKNSHWLEGGNLEEAKKLFLQRSIEKALKLSNQNKTKAAELLGISTRTMFRYLEDGKAMTDLS